MKKKIFTYTSALCIALSPNLALAQDKAEKKEGAETTEKTEAAKADVEVTIEGNDTMQYDVKEFSAKAGQTVKLTFKNVGKLPKAAMGHNIVILKKGTDMAGFATKAMSGGAAKDYMPPDEESMSKILAHTKLLGPGEEEVLTFTAPEAGEYDYLCTFPGHYAVMKGKMKVEAAADKKEEAGEKKEEAGKKMEEAK